jgi:S1-C subfamily serine protease
MGYLPEVVRIIAAHVNAPGGAKAIGTGFFLAVDGNMIKEEGLLLTNAHVVTNSPVVKIMTTYIEHQALPVTVVAVNHDRDLALLKVEPEVQQWLKRTLKDRYNLNHIPSLNFADSDTLRTGYEVHAVGHPLGLIDQQFTTGQYQGCVHLNNEIRGLSGALINGGNSGGPLLASFEAENQKSITGLHYFIPSKYKVMGINTFKLTGANVDGENGFIHANTVKRVLPTLLTPLKTRYDREKTVQSMLKNMTMKQIMAGNPVAHAMADHLTESEHQILQEMSVHKQAWSDHNIGGTINGAPRSFGSWLWRHVATPGTRHLHRGGPELLTKVLSFVKESDWGGLKEWKAGRRWAEVRSTLVDTEQPETTPSVIRILPPPATHIHSPRVGIHSHPIYTWDLLIHYECPKNSQNDWVAKGGVLVTDVEPKSLYEQQGGLSGDLIYKFENQNISADFNPAGTWYSEKRDLPMSLTDLCNDTNIDENIKLHVLRKGAGLVTIDIKNSQPKYSELPEIRQTYGYCDEGRLESNQKAQVQGIVFSPLRLQHVGLFNLVEYMAPNKRFNFKVIVENVSPESPAYASESVHAGSIVTHINDEPVAGNWKGVLAQLSKPHAKTNCWVLDTDSNGQKNKFVMAVRKQTVA